MADAAQHRALELQLPPYLDALLHSDDPLDDDYYEHEGDDDDEFGGTAPWGPEMSFAWRLPTLAPWKSLLRLDDDDDDDAEPDMSVKLRGSRLSAEDREVAEQLLRFLDMASVTLT